jgi:hypothetical protein
LILCRWFVELPWAHRAGVIVFLMACVVLKLAAGPGEWVPLGGDWAYPNSGQQARQLFEIATTSWSNAFVSFLGVYQINLFPAALFSGLIIWIGLPHVLLGLATLVYFSYLELARTLKVTGSVAALSGFMVFTLSAPFFNYFVMGWLYLLVAVSMLPLAVAAYIRALAGSSIHILLAGLLFSLSPIQSQATIWFLIVFFFLSLVSVIEGNGWGRSTAMFAAVITIFITCNAYWLPALFLYPPSHVANADLVTSEVSIGTFANFSLANMLRFWGGLFNFQFETIVNKHGGAFLSVVGSMLALVGLAWHPARYKWAFGMLMLFPLVILILGNNRELLELLPFSNAIRDVSRFIILALFGASVLALMGVAVITGWCQPRCGKAAGLGILLLLLAAANPWWSGRMWDWMDSNGRDIRLRTKEYPPSWWRLEQKLIAERLHQKALYYPVGGVISFKGDPRFHGPYQEASDIFANLSPVAGALTINDRKFGVLDEFMRKMADETPTADQMALLSQLGVRLFIFRHDVRSPYPQPSPSLVRHMVDTGKWLPWFKDESVDVYAATDFLPTVFVRPSKECTGAAPQLEYRRVSPTLYRVRVHGANCKFTLLLNESHHEQWRLLKAPVIEGRAKTSVDDQPVNWANDPSALSTHEFSKYLEAGVLTIKSGSPKVEFVSKVNHGSVQNNNLPEPSVGDIFSAKRTDAKHVLANQYVNGWEIDLILAGENAPVKTLDYFIEFAPQRVYLVGRWITLSALILSLMLVILWRFAAHRRRFAVSPPELKRTDNS